MEDLILEKFLEDFRQELQINPTFSNQSLSNLIQDGYYFLSKFKPNINIELDRTFRSLLKAHVFYSLNHELDTFFKNYSELIDTWIYDDMESQFYE